MTSTIENIIAHKKIFAERLRFVILRCFARKNSDINNITVCLIWARRGAGALAYECEQNRSWVRFAKVGNGSILLKKGAIKEY